MALPKPFWMINVLIFAPFVFFNLPLTEQQIVRDSANGLSFANFARHEKRKLDTHQLESVTVEQHSECLGRCLLNKNCISLNYGGNEGRECQLLEASKFDSPEKMTIDERFEHFSITGPCDKKPCLNGGKCIPDYKENSYRCQCPWRYNVLKSCEEGRVLFSSDGNWTAFWWYDAGTTWPSTEKDVLAYNFGHCRPRDPYCFGRLPSDARADATEMLAVDSEGTKYKWRFTDDSLTPARAAWRAFHGHHTVPSGNMKNGRPAWSPQVLSGTPPVNDQDSFMYREQNGVKSVLLDDDNCDCLSSLSLGHGMCGDGHTAYNNDRSVANRFGVDALYDPNCFGPRPGISLTLYFRKKP